MEPVRRVGAGRGSTAQLTRVSCRPDFFLPVRVLSRLFRHLRLEQLIAAHDAGRLPFFTDHAVPADRETFAAYLAPLHDTEWVVYVKKPFSAPEPVLSYRARCTHRVAIANSRLGRHRQRGRLVQVEELPRIEGAARIKVMTLPADEFFLIHGRPVRFHRIRHYGLFAKNRREQNIARARRLLNVPANRPRGDVPHRPASETLDNGRRRAGKLVLSDSLSISAGYPYRSRRPS
jgi:hypothetical protein